MAPREHLFGNVVRGNIERPLSVILQAHLICADRKPPRIAGEPSIPRRQLAIPIEAGMDRGQKIDHVFRHRARDVCPVIAKGRGLGSPPDLPAAGSTQGSGDLMRHDGQPALRSAAGPKPRVKAAFRAPRTVEPANHKCNDARERFGEDRSWQAGAASHFVISQEQAMALVRSCAGRLDVDLRHNGSRIFFAKDRGQPFGRDGAG